jgi:EpsI family protein
VQEQQTELAPGLPVNYLLIGKSRVRQVVYYWYLQNNRWVASEYSLKIYLGLDALFSGRNNGAFIRLITPANPGVEEAQGRLRLFAQSLLPVLQQFFHVEKNPGAAVGKEGVTGK